MPAPAGRRAPVGYRILVAARLDDHWSSWFDDLTLVDHSDGTTSLSGAVADQAQLHALLAKIRDLGISLISIQAIELPRDRVR